jgi:hypothetical protein
LSVSWVSAGWTVPRPPAVVLDPCTNSTLQKWNASNSIVTGPLHDVVEP